MRDAYRVKVQKKVFCRLIYALESERESFAARELGQSAATVSISGAAFGNAGVVHRCTPVLQCPQLYTYPVHTHTRQRDSTLLHFN